MNPNSALILIDIQQGFNDKIWGERNNPKFEKNIEFLLSFWRNTGMPVFHVRHDSKEENSPLRPACSGNSFMPYASPIKNELVVPKTVNSAFIGTDLKARLDDKEIAQLVIAGLTTDHCVSTTTRMAGNYGYKVILLEDCTATFGKSFNGEFYDAEIIHRVSLASLHQEFAEVMSLQAFQARRTS